MGVLARLHLLVPVVQTETVLQHLGQYLCCGGVCIEPGSAQVQLFLRLVKAVQEDGSAPERAEDTALPRTRTSFLRGVDGELGEVATGVTAASGHLLSLSENDQPLMIGVSSCSLTILAPRFLLWRMSFSVHSSRLLRALSPRVWLMGQSCSRSSNTVVDPAISVHCAITALFLKPPRARIRGVFGHVHSVT